MSRLPRWLAALMAAVAGASMPASAAGQEPPAEDAAPAIPEDPALEEAREQFRTGLARTAEGRLPEALEAFQRAYDLSPSYRILYNIGQVSRHVGDAARGLRALERYLREGGAEIEPARRAEVEAEIAALRRQVAELRVQAEPGAVVLVEGVALGKAPLAAPVYVNPGARRVRAERPGEPPVERTIEGRAGQVIEVKLSAPAESGPRPSPQPAPAPQPPPRPREPGPPIWIGWAATGALAAGAAVTGVLSLVSAAELADARYAGPDRRPPAGSEVSALGARVDALAIATDVLLVGAAVGLGVTLAVSLTSAGGGRGGAGKPRVALGAGPGGAFALGAF